jgi:hypothetical protein
MTALSEPRLREIEVLLLDSTRCVDGCEWRSHAMALMDDVRQRTVLTVESLAVTWALLQQEQTPSQMAAPDALCAPECPFREAARALIHNASRGPNVRGY